jgi:hypothetical protein
LSSVFGRRAKPTIVTLAEGRHRLRGYTMQGQVCGVRSPVAPKITMRTAAHSARRQPFAQRIWFR